MQHYSTDTKFSRIGQNQDLPNVNVTMVDKALEVDKKSENKHIRVLLVEDDPIVTRVTTMMLQSMQCDVVHAPNGDAALALIASEKFDLVLMDVGLPDKSGDEVTRIIRQWESEGKLKQHQLVFGLTAHVEKQYQDRCRAAGMDDVLTKPLNKSLLQKVIDELVV